MTTVMIKENSKEEVLKFMHDLANYIQIARHLSYRALKGTPAEDDSIMRGRSLLELLYFLFNKLVNLESGALEFTQCLGHLHGVLTQLKEQFGNVKALSSIALRLDDLLRDLVSPSDTPSGCDLKNTVQESVDTLRAAFELKGISLYTDLPAAGVKVMVNKTPFIRILENLLFNALKYTQAGGVVWVKSWSDDRGVHVSVSDTGKGIDIADQPFIFEEFYQADRTSPGMGLGLAIAREAIRRLGGELGVHSDGVGWGSTFRFFFPAPVENSGNRASLQYC